MVPSAKLIPASKSNAGDDSTPSLDSESALYGDLPDNRTNGAKISPPQRKRQQTGKVVDRKPKVRRRIGRVEGITAMPLEIFTEVRPPIE
ncbi:hypothetical protein BDV93DRAFT_527464 [Ceratobasidium sp. AG-I]|nr:hypothetical protein BDV93DRAFT_527464 [Ceratobasidium sp. AG-I]